MVFTFIFLIQLENSLIKKTKTHSFLFKKHSIRQDGWKYSLIKIPLVFENIIDGSLYHYFPDCYTLHKTTLVNF